jgi:hypothetical protein
MQWKVSVCGTKSCIHYSCFCFHNLITSYYITPSEGNTLKPSDILATVVPTLRLWEGYCLLQQHVVSIYRINPRIPGQGKREDDMYTVEEDKRWEGSSKACFTQAPSCHVIFPYSEFSAAVAWNSIAKWVSGEEYITVIANLKIFRKTEEDATIL